MQVTKVHATVKEIVSHGSDVYTLKFDVSSRYTKHKPGQFTHLCLDEFDPTQGYWPESRVFSIASEPRKNELTIVYSVKGSYTRRMASELSVGCKVWLKLPYGDFTIEDSVQNDQPIVLIAGGTGISPYIPYLVHSEKQNPNRSVRLFYGFRCTDLFLFQKELADAQRITPDLEVNLFVESLDKNFSVDGASVTIGQLSIDAVLSGLKDPRDPVYFLSGPPGMIDAFRTDLKANHISDINIKVDDWG